MKKILLLTITIVFVLLQSNAQNCNGLSCTATSTESRCAATGSITINAIGGSGNFKYRVLGPVNTNFTTSTIITGLAAGSYTVVVNDITTNCTFTLPNVVVVGNYDDPTFALIKTDVSCFNGSNGSITVTGTTGGRSPFNYTIVAPSTMGVGTSNGTGLFTNLIAGNYAIQLTDSCGAIQTRTVYINNYTWYISSHNFAKINCDTACGSIEVIDSKGNSSLTTGLLGFTYGIVRSVGDTVWSNTPDFCFAVNGATNFTIVVKDACNILQSLPLSISLVPTIGNMVVTTQLACSTFTATVTSITNFTGNFCLYTPTDSLIACNTTGVFTNVPYGSYCIKAHDICLDTFIVRCFTRLAPPISIGNNIVISNKVCNTFTATVVNQSGFTNPSFCLYDSSNVQVSCNATGVFNNLPYGSYCISAKDSCRDTTITRCFTVTRPRPVVNATITTFAITCTTTGVSLGGDSLTNPTFCLYDSVGTLIVCNNTGIFDSVPYGNYCINVHDSCWDTTFVRCFTLAAPIVTSDINHLTNNLTCTTFNVAIQTSLTINQYCLYFNDTTLVSCNTTGLFANLPYGRYCIRARNNCPDTTLIHCFTVNKPIAAVNASVLIANRTCTTFDAFITGQTNLTSPQYCLYNNANVQVACNTTGVFSNLPYGDYCIRIINGCNDTTINRCFTALLNVPVLNISTAKSCSYGYATITLTLSNTVLPAQIKVVRPNGNTFSENTYNTNTIVIDSVPAITGTQVYKIIVTDNCGAKDSTTISTIASVLTRQTTVENKCPSATWATGSGTIQTTVLSNMGSVQVRITKKNNVTLNPFLVPNISSSSDTGGLFKFIDLEPATYILRFKANDNCSKYVYDTVIVLPYSYPNLDRSSAYACDSNGFSVGAVVSNGVGPFTYQIIGSVPATPSIITAPQTSPIFNINNGSNYSLIRLRALDACGNASLNDASVLPLANTGITFTVDCFSAPATLTVDTINNAQYTWYKKLHINATDSVMIGTEPSYFVPNLSPLDTGIYVCKIIVNNGCITRLHYTHLNGDCWPGFLSTILKYFTGSLTQNSIKLQWVTLQETDVAAFKIEKLINRQFIPIGISNAIGNANSANHYSYIDSLLLLQNTYRLRLYYKNGSTKLSNIVSIKTGINNNQITIFPNPIQDKINISWTGKTYGSQQINLLNINGKIVLTKIVPQGSNTTTLDRNNLPSGIYVLTLLDTTTGATQQQKVILQ